MINNQIISGTKLPELTNPASKTDIVSGKKVIGADGKVITGTVFEVTKDNIDYTCQPMPQAAGVLNRFVTTGISNNLFAVEGRSQSSFLARQDALIRVPIVPSTLGNATAADVAAGKTFTSSQGFAVTGTNTAVANTIQTGTSFDLSSCSDTSYTQSFPIQIYYHLIQAYLCVIDIKGSIYIQPPTRATVSGNTYTYTTYVYGANATITITPERINISVQSNAKVPVKNCIKTIYFFGEINFK